MAAFDRDREAGRRNTHIVAPPGSGKTLLGVELVRRVGRRALVLTPNSAVQIQWPRAVRQFGAPSDIARMAGPEPAFPIAVMTYQSLCQLEDPGAAIRQVASARWATDRATATGVEVEEASAEGDALRRHGSRPARRRDRHDHRRRQARDRARRARRDRARGAVLRAGAQAHRRLQGRPHRHDRARRVPPPRVDVGLCRARAARRAARRGRPRDRPHRHAAVGPHRPRGRAVRRAARAGRLHGADAGRRARGPPRAVPGAGVADRAAGLRALVAGRARHALQRADHRAARGRRGAALVPGVGDHAHARAPPLGDRRRRAELGGLPARAAGARPRRRALPRLGRPCAAGRAPRAGSRTAARPTSTTGSCCSRTTRSAACTRRPRRRRPTATPPSAPRSPSSASSSRGAGSAAARRRSTGCSPARRPRRSGWSRCWRPRWRCAGTPCARSSCATPSWPRPSPTRCSAACSTRPRARPATR